MLNAGSALRLCLERGLTFVAFRRNGAVHLWVQREVGLEVLDLLDLHQACDRFVVSSFHDHLNRIHALRPDLRFQLDGSRFDPASLDGCLGTSAMLDRTTKPWDKDGHAVAVSEAKERIATGELRKVVLARTVTVQFDPVLLPALFREALERHP
ncbi:MAG: hypothetical protein WEC15_02085, partial [Flavobacteriales bacterium]